MNTHKKTRTVGEQGGLGKTLNTFHFVNYSTAGQLVQPICLIGEVLP